MEIISTFLGLRFVKDMITAISNNSLSIVILSAVIFGIWEILKALDYDLFNTVVYTDKSKGAYEISPDGNYIVKDEKGRPVRKGKDIKVNALIVLFSFVIGFLCELICTNFAVSSSIFCGLWIMVFSSSIYQMLKSLKNFAMIISAGYNALKELIAEKAEIRANKRAIRRTERNAKKQAELAEKLNSLNTTSNVIGTTCK